VKARTAAPRTTTTSFTFVPAADARARATAPVMYAVAYFRGVSRIRLPLTSTVSGTANDARTAATAAAGGSPPIGTFAMRTCAGSATGARGRAVGGGGFGIGRVGAGGFGFGFGFTRAGGGAVVVAGSAVVVAAVVAVVPVVAVIGSVSATTTADIDPAAAKPSTKSSTKKARFTGDLA
jgi:uncharacterized membrane protein